MAPRTNYCANGDQVDADLKVPCTVRLCNSAINEDSGTSKEQRMLWTNKSTSFIYEMEWSHGLPCPTAGAQSTEHTPPQGNHSWSKQVYQHPPLQPPPPAHRHNSISRSLALGKVWGASTVRQMSRPDFRVSQDQLCAADWGPLPWSLHYRNPRGIHNSLTLQPPYTAASTPQNPSHSLKPSQQRHSWVNDVTEAVSKKGPSAPFFASAPRLPSLFIAVEKRPPRVHVTGHWTYLMKRSGTVSTHNMHSR